LHRQLRGNRLEYDRWAELENPGWGYDDVLPYFCSSERSERGKTPERGTDGPLNVADLRDPNVTTAAFIRATEEAGIARAVDVNGPDQDGADYTQVTQKRGKRWSGRRVLQACPTAVQPDRGDGCPCDEDRPRTGHRR
jgi:choline dehydrogenase